MLGHAETLLENLPFPQVDKAALARAEQTLAGSTIRKVIIVPGKIVNIVVA